MSRRRLFRWNWEFSRSLQYQWELQSALLQSWISRVNRKNPHHSPLKLFIYSRGIFLKKCWINKICFFFQVFSGRRELKANLLFFNAGSLKNKKNNYKSLPKLISRCRSDSVGWSLWRPWAIKLTFGKLYSWIGNIFFDYISLVSSISFHMWINANYRKPNLLKIISWLFWNKFDLKKNNSIQKIEPCIRAYMNNFNKKFNQAYS